MAQGDTNVTVCNKALLFLGAEPITSFTDGTPGANACANIYEDTKKMTLATVSYTHLTLPTIYSV